MIKSKRSNRKTYIDAIALKSLWYQNSIIHSDNQNHPKEGKDTFLLSYIRNSNLSRVLTEAITLPPFKKEFAGLLHCLHLIFKLTTQYVSDGNEVMDSHRKPEIFRYILTFKYNAMNYRYFHLYANYMNIYEIGCKNS